MGGESLDEGVVLWRGCPVGVHVFKRERVGGDPVGEIFGLFVWLAIVILFAGAHCRRRRSVARVNEIYIPLQLYLQSKHYKVCIHVVLV